jgi:hypothetical protein
MSEPFDSVYPDFLRTGLGRLNQVGAQRELLSLFAALEHFRRDLHAQESATGILQVSHRYVAGLGLFRVSGFYLVNPADFGFALALCAPETARVELEAAVKNEIRTGRFSQALRRGSPVIFETGTGMITGRGVMHALALSNQVLGTFCGLLQHELAPVHEIAFSLLSLLLGESADALAALRKTTQLTDQITTLNGLLPICAWCKKVRDDQGYWEQIEQFVQSRSDASFSHGICPDCATKHFPI